MLINIKQKFVSYETSQTGLIQIPNVKKEILLGDTKCV
jgi:hypothetical protein